MLIDILISLIIIPALLQNQVQPDNFLVLDNEVKSEVIGPERVYTEVLDVKITAKNAIAVDAQTGKVLYQKNIEEYLDLFEEYDL